MFYQKNGEERQGLKRAVLFNTKRIKRFYHSRTNNDSALLIKKTIYRPLMILKGYIKERIVELIEFLALNSVK